MLTRFEAGDRPFVRLQFSHLTIPHHISRGVGTGVFEQPFLQVDGDQADVHSVRHLVLGIQATVLAAMEDVPGELIEPVQDFAGLGVHFADVLQRIVAEQAHEGSGNTVACTIHRGKHAPCVQFVEPGEITADPIPWHVEHEVAVEDALPIGFAGQDGTLDAPGIIDARGQVVVELSDLFTLVLQLGFLFGQDLGPLGHFSLHLLLIACEVIPHGEEGLSEHVLLTQWGVCSIELTLTHGSTEFTGSAESFGQAVQCPGHFTDLILAVGHGERVVNAP